MSQEPSNTGRRSDSPGPHLALGLSLLRVTATQLPFSAMAHALPEVAVCLHLRARCARLRHCGHLPRAWCNPEGARLLQTPLHPQEGCGSGQRSLVLGARHGGSTQGTAALQAPAPRPPRQPGPGMAVRVTHCGCFQESTPVTGLQTSASTCGGTSPARALLKPKGFTRETDTT